MRTLNFTLVQLESHMHVDITKDRLYCVDIISHIINNALCHPQLRPVAGYLNFCPGLLIDAQSAYDPLLTVVMHEMLHMLVRKC